MFQRSTEMLCRSMQGVMFFFMAAAAMAGCQWEQSAVDIPKSQLLGGTELDSLHKISQGGEVLGGVSKAPGIVIEWEGRDTPEGASPLEALRLVEDRMSHLQTTPMASDKNARALFAIVEAIDALEDKSDVSAPVGPGLPTDLGAEK